MPIAIAAAIAGVAGIGSALIGSSSASDAANAQVQAANTASQTQLNMYNGTVAREQPWVGAGQNALAELMNGMGLAQPSMGGGAGGGGWNQWGAYLQQYPDVMAEAQRQVSSGRFPSLDAYAQWHYQTYGQNDGHTLPAQPAAPAAPPGGAAQPPGFGSLVTPFSADKFQASPGYQYQLDQGNQAIQNSAAARGGLVSGNALKALQANGVGLANQDWYNAQNSYYQQQQQRFNMLQTLAGSGQNAAANLGALGSNVAGSIGNNIIGAGNAASAGMVAQGQTWANLLNNQSFLSGISSLFGGGGGNAGAGFGFDPSGMAGMGSAAFMPDMALPVTVG